MIRAKFTPRTMSQPHWHPEARYVTVIKGTWWTGAGAKFDPERTVPVRVSKPRWLRTTDFVLGLKR